MAIARVVDGRSAKANGWVSWVNPTWGRMLSWLDGNNYDSCGPMNGLIGFLCCY